MYLPLNFSTVTVRFARSIYMMMAESLMGQMVNLSNGQRVYQSDATCAKSGMRIWRRHGASLRQRISITSPLILSHVLSISFRVRAGLMCRIRKLWMLSYCCILFLNRMRKQTRRTLGLSLLVYPEECTNG